jgi:RES domain-containing protein
VHDEAKINAVLQSLPLVRFNRYVTRFIFEAHRGAALDVAGALRVGGRYNPPGTPALYTSLRRVTALTEATQLFEDEDPVKPMVMLTVRVDSRKIADLTSPAALRALGTNRAELTALIIDKQPGNAVPQVLGRIAHETGRIEGLLVWSRVSQRERNLILFPDRLGMRYDLYDPAADLPSLHPEIIEAMRALMHIDSA